MTNRRQAQTWRDDPKDAVDLLPHQWVVSGVPGLYRLEGSVVCGSQEMRVKAVDRGHGNVQVMLSVVGVDGNLARLCMDPCHSGQVHWHWYENMTGLVEETQDVPGLVGADRAAMLEEFLQRLKISGFVTQEGMVP